MNYDNIMNYVYNDDIGQIKFMDKQFIFIYLFLNASLVKGYILK